MKELTGRAKNCFDTVQKFMHQVIHALESRSRYRVMGVRLFLNC